MTNRFVVMETSWKEHGRTVSGWHVVDRETGDRAKGTEPSQTQSVAWKLKNKMNAAVDKKGKKK